MDKFPDARDNTSMKGSYRISWMAYEHSHRQRSDDWFWGVGIVAVAIAVLAVYFGNVLFGIFILLAAFTSIMVAHREPEVIPFEINKRGVQAGKILYPFSTIESFWIIDEDESGQDKLIMKSEKTLMPLIIVPLDDNLDFEEVRDYLLQFLNEEEMDEPLSHKIMEYFGF